MRGGKRPRNWKSDWQPNDTYACRTLVRIGDRMAKLTLSMPAKDIQAAHRIAKQNKTSISSMMLRIVRVMSMRKKPRGRRDEELPPLTKKLSGILPNPKGKSDRQLIEDALLDKHGLDG